MTRGLFVTGTDTGVGKTRVSCTLLRALRDRGIDAAGLKPAETGAGPEGPADAKALREAAGGGDPLELVGPQVFALPAAPPVAAEAEGRRVDRAAIRAAFDALAKRHDFLVVEGAGGLRVPVDGELDMAGLAAELGLPLLVVARAALGTINHTRLTLEAARVAGLPVVGVVISHADGALSDADARNLAWLRHWLGPRLVGEVPPLAPEAPVPGDALDLEQILARTPAGAQPAPP